LFKSKGSLKNPMLIIRLKEFYSNSNKFSGAIDFKFIFINHFKNTLDNNIFPYGDSGIEIILIYFLNLRPRRGI